MNPTDDQLNRLFRAAHKATPEAAVQAPYGLETRAMAAWRTGRAGETGLWDARMLVRGLVLAIAIMGISFWSMADKTTDPFSEYVQLADTTITSDVNP